jgi:hypothetical protein
MISCFGLPFFWETYGTSKGLEGLCLLPFAVATAVFFATRKLYAAEERDAEIEYVQAVQIGNIDGSVCDAELIGE